MSTLYTFRDKMIPHYSYRTDSVHFFGLMNSATKSTVQDPCEP